MNFWIFLIAATLLSLERICYVWAWRSPESFRAFCHRPAVASLGEPVAVLQKLFYCFKGLQFAVFLGWCYFHGQESFLLLHESGFSLAVGGALIFTGQVLNFSVFYRLGRIGVFYGCKLGYEIPLCREFPFSFLKHPQYVGALFSIWGFFLALRFPHDDWFLLPTLQTVYYALGAYFEQWAGSTRGYGDPLGPVKVEERVNALVYSCKRVSCAQTRKYASVQAGP